MGQERVGWVLKGSRVVLIDDAGQSLIEVAAYYFAGVVASAAREGANYAARNEMATLAQVTQRACDSTGMVAFGNACPGLTVTCASANGDATVEVVYGFSLITASIADSAFRVNPLPIHAAARFPIMTSGTPCAS